MVMHNPSMCDKHVTSCDGTQNLKHANSNPQQSLTTQIIVYIV